MGQKQTHFFCQVNEGDIVPDNSAPLNPRPHTIWRKPGDESTYFDGFGFIPFFRLDNGQKQFSGLKTIKGLIDDYDLMSCGLSNNIQDANEVLYVVKGFEGDNLDELMTNIRAKSTSASRIPAATLRFARLTFPIRRARRSWNWTKRTSTASAWASTRRRSATAT